MFKHRSRFRHFLDVWPSAFNWLLQNGNLCVTALLDFSLIKVEVLIITHLFWCTISPQFQLPRDVSILASSIQ